MRILLPSNWIYLGVASGGTWEGGKDKQEQAGFSFVPLFCLKMGAWHLEKAKLEGHKTDQR